MATETCPKCGSTDVQEKWAIGKPDRFFCLNCKARWIDGQREKVK